MYYMRRNKMDGEKIIKEIAKELPANEVYTDLFKPSFTQLGKTGEYILKFVALPFSFLGMTAEELEKKYKTFITTALNKVPKDKRQKPSPLVAGPLLEYIKYLFACEQEKSLENMFSELLGNASNKDIQPYVQPSYVYTLQQLTWIEAEILKSMFDYESDGDCLGITFSRFTRTDCKVLQVLSDEAEPLEIEQDEDISYVFYQYFVPVLDDDIEVTNVIFEKALNILQQLNLIITFKLNKYKNGDKYSLDKHDEDHVDEFDAYGKETAYALTSYAEDMMELCINPKDNMRVWFKCNNCGSIFQNVNKNACCRSCKSENVELL